MSTIFLGIIITGCLTLSFLYLLFAGLRKKNKKPIFLSLLFLFTAVLVGLWTSSIVATKAYKRVSNITIDNPFRARSGQEIYQALFGKPLENCVAVTNKMDQTVPRLDCCIWLEFKICPAELKRIIALAPYKELVVSASDTSSFPSYSPRPEWFQPKLLGEHLIVLQNHNPDNPNRDQLLFFAKDSMHAFYCDMAD